MIEPANKIVLEMHLGCNHLKIQLLFYYNFIFFYTPISLFNKNLKWQGFETIKIKSEGKKSPRSLYD